MLRAGRHHGPPPGQGPGAGSPRRATRPHPRSRIASRDQRAVHGPRLDRNQGWGSFRGGRAINRRPTRGDGRRAGGDGTIRRRRRVIGPWSRARSTRFRLVEGAKRKGHIVAMTGRTGVNDAPAAGRRGRHRASRWGSPATRSVQEGGRRWILPTDDDFADQSSKGGGAGPGGTPSTGQLKKYILLPDGLAGRHESRLFLRREPSLNIAGGVPAGCQLQNLWVNFTPGLPRAVVSATARRPGGPWRRPPAGASDGSGC